MNRNNNTYKWCNYFNNGQGAWGFHWKDGHEEWKIKQGKKPYVRFSNPSTNALIYCSYLINTSGESMEKEPKGGDDSQCNDFISLSLFWVNQMTPKESLLSPNAIYLLFYDVYVALDIDWDGSLWTWSLRTSSIQCHNKPVSVPPCKPPDPVRGIYDGQT